MNTSLTSFGCIAAALIAFSTPITAQQATTAASQGNFVEEVGGSERINLSGKLRMLSQRIPAAACNLHAGIVPDDSRALLNSAVAEFDQILAGLEHGDEELGMFGEEERSRTLRVIEEVHNRFDPLEDALGDMMQDVPSDAAIQVLADENMDVLEVAKLLVFEISTEYANPAALLQSDAMTIDLAGRQRLLTQKASKEVCFIMSDVNAAASREALGETVNMFEVSLDALRNGMDQLGVQPPPNDEIASGLGQVHEDWLAIKTDLDAVIAGGTLSDDARALVFQGLNTTMADMNQVVGLYTAASKLGL